MPINEHLTLAEKRRKLKKLDNTLDRLKEATIKDNIFQQSPTLQSLTTIVAILVQFAKDHEHLFLSFVETYRR